jgi:hypothetical protein
VDGDGETDALNEGFGDVLAAATEMYNRKYTGPGGFCALGDLYNNLPDKCERNFEQPALSLACTTRSYVCPSDYRGPQYCTIPIDCGALLAIKRQTASVIG